MTVVYATFDCTRCGASKVKEVDTGVAVVYEEIPGGGSRGHQACARCRAEIAKNNAAVSGRMTMNRPVSVSVEQAAPQPSAQENRALEMIASALLTISEGQQKILDQLKQMQPSTPAPVDFVPDSPDEFDDGELSG